jgi:GxxExxY protein
MNADTRGLKHKELTETIIGVFYEVYNELGHGFLESVYEKAFEVALTARGLMSVVRLLCRFGFVGTVLATSRRTS